LSRILGIDPGSRVTGYGVIDDTIDGPKLLAWGCIRMDMEHFPTRLKHIFDGIQKVVAEYRPEELAVEQVFMHKNADSALKLGQARGVAICAALTANLPVYEYSAKQVKQALVGNGNADKVQVAHMVKFLLKNQSTMVLDASDALGVALCHAHHQQTARRMARLQGKGR
jgi:crossover junction endodeoxyribonuclease RuvC